MNTVARSVLGVALAAGAMYLFDPVSGRRRRLILRDQCANAARRVEDGTREVRKVLTMQAKPRFGGEHSEKKDKKTAERIRGALRAAVSRPGAIDIAVQDGRVTLRGEVFAHEHERLLNAIRAVNGVSLVTDYVTDRERARERAEVAQSLRDGGAEKHGWTLTSRLLVGTAGCALLAWGIRERKTLSSVGAELGELGQTLWRTAKHEIEENLENAKSAIARGESALDAARDTAKAGAAEFGGGRRPGGPKSDTHAHST